MDREQKLRKLASKAAGLRYDSKRAQKILDAEDWSDFWPIVDNNGMLTGGITDAQERYINVEDLAMVDFGDLTQEQIAANGGLDKINMHGGYVNLFPKKEKQT